MADSVSGTLASINIAVFLFEIASPIRNSDLELFFIPLLYGTKINHLLVVGEWWRLLTPMFLGPVFAIIGAWLTYQMQNRDVDDMDTSEAMFQKAIVFTAACFILSHFCPIDEWSHLGSAITGMAYGHFTSPRFELKDASSASSSSGTKLVRQYGDSCRSTFGDSCRSAFVFTIFIIALSSFLFFMEPPLNALASVDEVVHDYLVFYMSESSQF